MIEYIKNTRCFSIATGATKLKGRRPHDLITKEKLVCKQILACFTKLGKHKKIPASVPIPKRVLDYILHIQRLYI